MVEEKTMQLNFPTARRVKIRINNGPLQTFWTTSDSAMWMLGDLQRCRDIKPFDVVEIVSGVNETPCKWTRIFKAGPWDKEATLRWCAVN